MANNNDWIHKKRRLSVNNLRLWGQNPRLDPQMTYTTTRDFADEIISSPADRLGFLELIKSITVQGFIQADPIVVWQNELNNKYYVAEGNRRILALKLLRQPSKAPKSIRGLLVKLSSQINIDDLEKIYVSIAPTFSDVEWYLSQRHSSVSNQRRWSTEQQKRWISDLYDKYDGNIDLIRTKIQITEGDMQDAVRSLKLKAFIDEIDDKLTETEFRNARSHTFPLTTLIRFFGYSSVRDAWGVEYEGYEVQLLKDRSSFLTAFAELIKRILLPEGVEGRIDSRSVARNTDADAILSTLSTVEEVSEEENPEEEESDTDPGSSDSGTNEMEPETGPTGPTPEERERERRNGLKNDPDRRKIINYFYKIEVDSHKLTSLFQELKDIPLKYENARAASIRVFLDLCVLEYIKSEGLTEKIQRHYAVSLREIPLKKRLEFIKKNITEANAKKTITSLLTYTNDYSLDVLNGYVHSDVTHYSYNQFLNRFWDFLFPLFRKLVEINET